MFGNTIMSVNVAQKRMNYMLLYIIIIIIIINIYYYY